ncbi:MAG TPA: hypothetical protein VFN75_10520 [Pseudonocardiaceae bacterium]|nr:hypothetical protein [Pseudonocardiaceae bacterium]
MGAYISEGASPPGHTAAGQYGEAERERLGTGVQRGVAKLLVAGIQSATVVTIALVHRRLLTG